MDTDGRVRSYNARRGRLSALTVERIETPRAAARDRRPTGRWCASEAFGRSAPVVLEVGCGHGAAALAYAADHPGHDLLAVDVFTPALARMLAGGRAPWADQPLDAPRATRSSCSTDRVRAGVARGRARVLPRPVAQGQARQAPVRLAAAPSTSSPSGSSPGGHLLVATDHDGYAAHVRSAFAAHGGFEVTEGERPAWRPTDGFEAKGLAAGRRVSEFRATLRDVAAWGGCTGAGRPWLSPGSW